MSLREIFTLVAATSAIRCFIDCILEILEIKSSETWGTFIVWTKGHFIVLMLCGGFISLVVSLIGFIWTNP